MEMLTHAVSWFEIPVIDFERAKKFYETILDFEMPENIMGETRMGFLLFDFKSGGIGGAICHGEGYEPSDKGALVYLNGGEDLNVVLQRVENAGGTIVLPKTHINNEIGHFAVFLDPEGNRLALHSRN